MREQTRRRMTTALWLVAIVIPFVGYVPWRLRQLEGPFVWEGALGQWLGVWCLLNGIGLAGLCVYLFEVYGRGTPLPTAPPSAFVVAGPYRFVRNPMALGLLLLLGGEALLGRSRLMLLYGLAVFAAVHAFVVFVEEPGLQRRFGDAYARYRQQVPRWIPRIPAGSRPCSPPPISRAPHPKSR